MDNTTISSVELIHRHTFTHLQKIELILDLKLKMYEFVDIYNIGIMLQ